MQPLEKAVDHDRSSSHHPRGLMGYIAFGRNDGRPLPRFARRLIRTFENFSFTRFALHPRTLAASGMVGLLSVGYYLSDENRVLGAAFASVSSQAGFSVSKLVVNGNEFLDEVDVEKQLAPVLGSSLLALDVASARDELDKSRWIKTSTIKKVYPDTLLVDIVEREPVALWKSNETLILIARDGFAIDEAQAQHMHLPQVVGDGANTVASEFLTVISRFPTLVSRAEAYVRVADRRWNLVLDNGIRVLLPADGWQDALAELNTMQSEKRLLDREIVQVDMRLPDRLVLKLEPEDAKTRREAVEKVMKRSWHKT